LTRVKSSIVDIKARQKCVAAFMGLRDSFHLLFDLDLPRIRGHGVKQYLGGIGKDNGRHEEEIHQGVQA
jgi:hypothetical protein